MTLSEGLRLPSDICFIAKFNPDESNCRDLRWTFKKKNFKHFEDQIQNTYLTNKTNRSERLQCSGACGVIEASADIKADNGAHFASATSKIQSHNATTKFNFANVSLCVRSNNVSTGKSGA